MLQYIISSLKYSQIKVFLYLIKNAQVSEVILKNSIKMKIDIIKSIHILNILLYNI